VASGYASIPHYRGSASNRDIVLPLPLAIYRGKKHSVNEEGAHRRLFSSDKMRLELSLSAGLPVPEGNIDTVRAGMPALDATLEIGPRFALSLWKKKGQLLSLNFPLRAVSSVSFRQLGLHGWVLAPYIYYRNKSSRSGGWQFNIAAGPQYGSRRFHQYYYAVTPRYVIDGRQAYQAEAGYGGSRITVYSQKTINRLWLSAFARYDDLSGASFIDSPLVEKKYTLMAGFVVGWIIAKSPRYVPVLN